MSEEKSAVKPVVNPIPENLPEELLPLYDWWRSNGKQTLSAVAVFAVVVGGALAFKYVRAAKSAQANQELMKASSLDELESTVAKFGSTKVGNAARLRLAKAYYDAAKYDEALNAYDTCLSKGAPEGFQEIAELGRAHTLEALGQLDKALEAFQAFEKNKGDHFLQPKAVMGAARVLTLQGKKDEATTLLENLKADKTGNEEWEAAVANLEEIIKRYEPRAARSLFEAAEEVAGKMESSPPVEAATQAAPQAADATPKAD